MEEVLREEMEEERSCEDESVSLVGLRVVAIDPLEVIVRIDFEGANWRKEKKGRRKEMAGMKFVMSLLRLVNVKARRGPLRASAYSSRR